MSAAALALALALLTAPRPSRHRLSARQPVRSKSPRLSVASGLALTAIMLSLVAAATSVGVVAAVAIVGATVEIRRRSRKRRRSRAAEAVALRGALDILVGELRVGAHPVAAFGVAAEETDGVVAAALRTIAARARLGADVAAGMLSVARHSSLPGQWERLAVCWQLAQTHGLAIGTLMETAQRDLVERQRFSSRVEAGMAGARTTAAVLSGLPVIGIGLGQLIGADPLTFLLSGGFGEWLLVIGVLLACAGLLWCDRIICAVSR
ncbi:type II secretion system F family protein [Mycobacterium neglectum]|uniref:type II secretion system F family protein n=1 Tax=Mycobacterium neglectum TaxID=242737 RepID=UPI000BFEBB71|nr:type II secretion system F family protein [Mycobacterium neglectum]